MASSSYTISLPLQLPRYASSARLGLSTLNARARLQTTAKGLRSIAATSYQHEEAGNGDKGGIDATTTSALHLMAGDDAAAAELVPVAARVRRGAPRSPNAPGAPREGSGGSGGTVHAALPPTLLRLPKEGSGGQGGSVH